MKRGIISIFILFSINCYSQCSIPQSTFTNNIYFFSANLNWSPVIGVHHYKIRYKEIAATPWSYKNNIDSGVVSKVLNNLVSQSDYIWQIRSHCDTTNTDYSSWSAVDTFNTTTMLCPTPSGLITRNLSLVNGNLNNANIPVLQQNTTYEWQIMAYHDSTLNMGSLWSASDTFTTSIFVPAPFNPIINTIIGNNQCNTPSTLMIEIDQAQNEPDIGTSTISTDGGYFNISSVSTGDSVGYAILNSATQNVNAVLRAGLIAGPNYAIINSYDTSNSLIGFFAIENTSSGIRVTTTSPNDGNNYTAGFNSEINFTNLYVTPNYSGDLNIVILLESEFNEQVYFSDTVNIQCSSTIDEIVKDKRIHQIHDLFGRKSKQEKNKFLIYQYRDGRTTKKIILE
jgi:hypothetical protein